MATYVDDWYKSDVGNWRDVRTSRLVADTRSELVAIGRLIGLGEDRLWFPKSSAKIHFRVSVQKREAALRAGAYPIEFENIGQVQCDLGR